MTVKSDQMRRSQIVEARWSTSQVPSAKVPVYFQLVIQQGKFDVTFQHIFLYFPFLAAMRRF